MTVKYPDISNYQSGLDLTGAELVIAKATEGGTYTDPSYVKFRDQAKARKIPFAAYHWVNTTDVNAQAAHAFSVVGKDIPMMWDCEANGATVPRIVALNRAYKALGGKPKLVYLPHWWWQNLGSPNLVPLILEGLSLVSSNYTTYSDTGPGWNAYGGMRPVIWQYSNNQSFNGKACDFNAFRGTIQELLTFVGIAQGGTMEQTDKLAFPSPNNTDRRIGNVFTDLDNLRDYLIDGSGSSASPAPGAAGYPKPTSPLGKLVAFLNNPAAAVTLTDAQLATLSAQVVAAIQPQLDEMKREVADLRARLASGAQATHDALSD